MSCRAFQHACSETFWKPLKKWAADKWEDAKEPLMVVGVLIGLVLIGLLIIVLPTPQITTPTAILILAAVIASRK